MRKYWILFLLILSVAFFSCSNPVGMEDATEEGEIFNHQDIANARGSSPNVSSGDIIYLRCKGLIHSDVRKDYEYIASYGTSVLLSKEPTPWRILEVPGKTDTYMLQSMDTGNVLSADWDGGYKPSGVEMVPLSSAGMETQWLINNGISTPGVPMHITNIQPPVGGARQPRIWRLIGVHDTPFVYRSPSGNNQAIGSMEWEVEIFDYTTLPGNHWISARKFNSSTGTVQALHHTSAVLHNGANHSVKISFTVNNDRKPANYGSVAGCAYREYVYPVWENRVFYYDPRDWVEITMISQSGKVDSYLVSLNGVHHNDNPTYFGRRRVSGGHSFEKHYRYEYGYNLAIPEFQFRIAPRFSDPVRSVSVKPYATLVENTSNVLPQVHKNRLPTSSWYPNIHNMDRADDIGGRITSFSWHNP